MASGRLADYLGKGLASERPATLDLHPEAVGFWYSSDTGQWSAWDGAAWLENIMGGGGSGGGDVTGPGVSVDGSIALFDGVTGKLLKDAEKSITDLRAPSIQTLASAGTVTPTFGNDLVTITAQAAALTIANPTGTAIPGLGLVIRIKDNGTARAITWGSQYRGIGVALPTTTVATKTTYVAMIYNSTDTTWDVVAVGTQA